MIMTMIIQCTINSIHNTKYIDIIIGKTYSSKDKYNILCHLLRALKPDLLRIGFSNNSNSNAKVIVNKNSDKCCTTFNVVDYDMELNFILIENMKLELRLASYVKFLMMICSREGHDKSQCIFCTMSYSKMNKYYKTLCADEEYSSLKFWRI